MTEAPLTFAYAFLLGLMHSLEPSHAKAVLASYFLNRKRTAMEAVIFATTVTLAHTFVIYALAALGYWLGPKFRSEMMESWGTWLGGGLLMAVGAWMFWNERRVQFHRHDSCCHDHSHGHFFHHHLRHDHAKTSSLREIFLLGFCSGAIPCMSGVTVLVLAWTTASPMRGLSLVAVFSAGLGLVVLAMCLAMQQAARLMDRFWEQSERWSRFLPIASSALIFLMGTIVVAWGFVK